METITIDVAIYGPLARAVGGKHIACKKIEMAPATTLGNLRAALGIKEEDTGYIFINAILCDVPGLHASRNLPLKDGDHIGFFSKVHMWPYQYRDGAQMTQELKDTLRERGAMHHSYSTSGDDCTNHSVK
ncbi:MAG: hypothetical protein JXB07_21410 [Anaerolineae bacterium]|nr:hypothetical protein [Anaerolineae bacterium]